MTTYRVQLDLPSFSEGVERINVLFNAIGLKFGELCLEAHFKTIQSIQLLDRATKWDNYAIYCWRPIVNSADLQIGRRIRRAQILSGNRSLRVYPELKVAPYQSNHKHQPRTRIAYSEFGLPPEKFRLTDERQERTIDSILTALAKSSVKVNRESIVCSISWKGGSCDHSYSMPIADELIIPTLERLGSLFGLPDAIGSFEILGTPGDLERMKSDPKWRTTDFPQGSPSFNAAYGKTPFALNCASLNFPVLNLGHPELERVAPVIDAISADLTRVSVVRSYLSWPLPNNTLSPALSGNYVFLSRQSKGYTLYFGFDRYADEDPPISRYVSSISSKMANLGLNLQKVAYPK